MERNDFVSHVHRKRPKGRPMPEAIRRANNAKSKIRSRVEHVFAEPRSRERRAETLHIRRLENGLERPCGRSRPAPRHLPSLVVADAFAG
jgi:hypothetical protein